MQCHQGRQSKVSVDKKITDFNITDVDAVVKPMTDASWQDCQLWFRQCPLLRRRRHPLRFAGPDGL